MRKCSPFRYFKSSPENIRLAVMPIVRFSPWFQPVKDLLHQRGIDVGHELNRFWWNRFGPMFASENRWRRVQQLQAFSTWQRHVDEVFVKINGEQHDLWRAVDHEGEVLKNIVAKRKNKRAALKFLRKAMRRYVRPEALVADRFPSYRTEFRALGCAELLTCGIWLNNRLEISHLPFRRRGRAVQRFRRLRSLQKFAAVHALVHTHFNQVRSLYSRNRIKLNRAAALSEWRRLGAT